MISIFFFFSSIIFLQTSSMAQEEIVNPLYGFSSREEMVQLAGYGEEKLSTVLVTGTVLCEACLHGEPYIRSWPVSGALVAVHCRTGRKWSKTTSARAVTDEYGDFLIDLPSHLHAMPNLDRTCLVKVLRTPKNSSCRPAYGRKNKALVLSSFGKGIRTYTAGKIKFLDLTSRPLQACTKTTNSDEQIAW
uniref:Pollen Ole e 1 allergen and extensin family protein n=1 Tax=Rhizophora mucronata TaxID=61149 RepID=A0A2P2P2X1_RHIMU